LLPYTNTNPRDTSNYAFNGLQNTPQYVQMDSGVGGTVGLAFLYDPSSAYGANFSEDPGFPPASDSPAQASVLFGTFEQVGASFQALLAEPRAQVERSAPSRY